MNAPLIASTAPFKPGYGSGYEGNRFKSLEEIVQDIELMITKIDHHFNTGTRFDKNFLRLAQHLCPNWVEHFFPQIRWEEIALTYTDAVHTILNIIQFKRPDSMTWEIQRKIESTHRFSQPQRAQTGFELLRSHQKGDIIIMPAQFGLRHAGLSVYEVQKKLEKGEFNLSEFQILFMLFVEPERLLSDDDLWMDCATDYISEDPDEPHLTGTYVRCFGQELSIEDSDPMEPGPQCGSPTLFVPDF